MSPITCIEDLRQQYKNRVPKMFCDYADSGSWTEQTYRANETDFQRILLRQRVAIDVGQRDITTTILDHKVTMPVALAPIGMAGMQHADGEILAAQAAEQFGIPFTLSTMSICSIEDVAAHTQKPFWFQLYWMKNREFNEQLIERAKAARCSALVLTLDCQMLGQRHKDIKNGLSTPPKLTLPNIINMATKPKWCLNMLKTHRRNFGNIVGHVEGVHDMASTATWANRHLQRSPDLTWDDMEWIKHRWGGKLILKGIFDVENAKIAAQTGADALIVSNHGGRQLDGAASSISMLPKIAEAVGHNIDVWMDSGIRSGQDVLKALALGAKCVLLGRAFLYGLGANGRTGVTDCLNIIAKELDTTMGLCGIRDIHSIDKSVLVEKI